jgi:hypothetical protein
MVTRSRISETSVDGLSRRFERDHGGVGDVLLGRSMNFMRL